jgi:hypothetical protein
MGGDAAAMDDNGQWVSVADAARTLGVTRQAIQGRIKRDTIEHRHDNRGNPIVRVTSPIAQCVSGAMGSNAAAMAVAEDAPLQACGYPTGTPGMMPLAAHLATIEAIQATHREAMAALRADLESERQRRDADMEAERQRHSAETTRLRAGHAKERWIDHILACLVIAAGIAVICIVVPVVWR